jgi:hypothetical protein
MQHKDLIRKNRWRFFSRIFLAFLGVCVFAVQSPPASAALTFLNYDNVFYLSQGDTDTFDSDNTGLSGTFQVVAKLVVPSGGQVDEVVVNGVSVSDGAGNVEIFAAYDFSANGGVLSLPISPVAGKYGISLLEIIIDPGGVNEQSASVEIDTRLSEDINIEAGQRYGKDPYGGLLDFDPSGIAGVAVTNTHITGLIWSESFGWIDLQPPYGGVTHVISSPNRSDLDGFAWNDNIGWIDFGQIDDQGGVYIDEEGYFQGTAWSENFGFFSFGDSMALDPTEDNPGDTAIVKSQWTKTSWRFTNQWAPTISLVSPVDGENTFIDRSPDFEFTIEDADSWNKVGYIINVNKNNSSGGWSSYEFETHPADLDFNDPSNPLDTHTHTFADDFPPGEYRWQMRAFDEGGLWSDFTEYWFFTIPNGNPTVTLETPLSPADGDTVDSDYLAAPYEYGGVAFPSSSLRQPIFQFTITEPDNEEVRYIVEISDQPDFSNILSQSSSLSGYVSPTAAGDTYEYIPVNRLPMGTLYWRVRVSDVFGAVPDSVPEWEFDIENEPPSLSGVSLRDDVDAVIGNGDTTNDTVPAIQWISDDPDGINMETTVEVYNLGDVPGVDAPVWDNLGAPFIHNTGFQERMIGPLGVGDYFYRIRTCDSDLECTAWTTSNFTIAGLTRFGNIGTPGVAIVHPGAMIDPAVHVPDAIDPSAVDADSTNNKFSGNSAVGWIDMNPDGGGVLVNNDRLQGYAWSNTVGWIRMNCEASDPSFGIIMADDGDCTANGYGVTNVGGNLAGKALIETTGKYLYFDEATYISDFGGADHWPLSGPDPDETIIRCDDDYEGHFDGWAFAPDIGWVAYGRQALVDMGTSNDDASDYFSMTEWDCGAEEGPELNADNIYVVFSARQTDYSFPIANRNPDPFSGDIACGSGTDTVIDIQKMHRDGKIDSGVNLSEGVDFEVECVNPDGDYDGNIWLTLTDDGTYPLNQKPGLYRIVGTVADAIGETTEFPGTGDPDAIHDFVADPTYPGSDPDDEYIIQIVAGTPSMSTTGTITYEKSDSSGTLPEDEQLIADGDDTMTIIFDLLDQFGNEVTDAYKYEIDPAAPDAVQLKEVDEMRVVFHDQVDLDQVEGLSAPKQAVSFPLSQRDPSVAAEFDNGYPSVQYVDSPSFNPTIGPVVITSIAPTNYQNTLTINRIQAKIDQTLDANDYTGPTGPGGVIEVGQIEGTCGDANGDGDDDCKDGIKRNYPSSPTLSFDPVAEGTIGDLSAAFGAGAFAGSSSSLNVSIENMSNTQSVGRFDWMGVLRTIEEASGLQGGTTFEDVFVNYGGTDSNANDFYWTEVSTVSPFVENITPSQFSLILPTLLMTPGDLFVKDDDTLPNAIAAGTTLDFTFNATPENLPDLTATPPDPNEITEFYQYFAVEMLPGKIVKIPFQSGSSDEDASEVVLSIIGSTHGEQFDPDKIVGETYDEFTEIGSVYDRQEIRKIMYENYRDITGLKAPDYIPGGGDELEVLKDWGEFASKRPLSTFSNRALQESEIEPGKGKVLWYEREPASNTLTVTLGDDTDLLLDTTDDPWEPTSRFAIPGDLGPITLLVRGGNIYIRDDITVGEGTNLGIIALSSRENSSKGTEGNIIISPEVTRLEAVFYADGSILMAKDEDLNNRITEDEIFDGFEADSDVIEQFENQLYIKGSIVSQNTAGEFLKDGSNIILPVDTWRPTECPTWDNCGGGNVEMSQAARRYDLSFMRLFRLGYEYDDEDDDEVETKRIVILIIKM